MQLQILKFTLYDFNCGKQILKKFPLMTNWNNDIINDKKKNFSLISILTAKWQPIV